MAEDVVAVLDAAGLRSICGRLFDGRLYRFASARRRIPQRVSKLRSAGSANIICAGPDRAVRRAAGTCRGAADPRQRQHRRAAGAHVPEFRRTARQGPYRAGRLHARHVATSAAGEFGGHAAAGSGGVRRGRPDRGPARTAGGRIRRWLAVTIPGRDHMSAVGERRTRQAVVDFFAA